MVQRFRIVCTLRVAADGVEKLQSFSARCKAARATRHAPRSHAAQPTLLNSTGVLAAGSGAVPSTSAAMPATLAQSTPAWMKSPGFVLRAGQIVDVERAAVHGARADFQHRRRERPDADHQPLRARRFVVDRLFAGREGNHDIDGIRHVGARQRLQIARLVAMRGAKRLAPSPAHCPSPTRAHRGTVRRSPPA